MPQISATAYRALPLRAHAFLAGVPLHDVWAVDLPRFREHVTLAEFQNRERSTGYLSPPARTLLRLRFFLGRIFRLENPPSDAGATSFALRLTDEDRARSLVKAGSLDGIFQVVYRFEGEQLVEIHNRTAHAAAVSVLTETSAGYRYYFAIYVANTGWATRFYMALIDPFRKLFIYPSLLKKIRASWIEAEAVYFNG